MAEVFSNSPCATSMLGKRVLSPSAHGASPHTSSSSANNGNGMLPGGAAAPTSQNLQLDFGANAFGSSKKRQRFGQDHQGVFDRYESAGAGAALGTLPQRSLSPARAGKRARPLSYLQPSSSSSSFSSPSGQNQGLFGFKPSNPSSLAGKDSRAEQEVTGLRREVGALRAHASEKEGELAVAKEENARLRDGVGMYQKELERLTSENRILKRAVGIQNNKGKELENQLHNLQQTAGQAAEYIKRLEQTNYALSVRVQAMGNSGSNDFLGGQRPPDVY